MNSVEAASESKCPECGAQLKHASSCWLCGARLTESVPPIVRSPPIGPTDSVAAQPFSFSLEGLMLVVTLVAVCLGAFTLFPGLGILLAILMAPVFVRTTMVVRRRQELGKESNFLARVGLFLGSFATAMVILVVVTVVAFGTFCAVCLSIGREEAIPFAAGIAILVTIGALVLIARWVRARWRRDTLAE